MRTLASEPQLELPMGHESVSGVMKNQGWGHADFGLSALVGAPYGARKCVRGHEE